MQIKKLKINEESGQWCEVTLEIRKNRQGGPLLSITGSAGYVTTEEEARTEAKEVWISYFEDSRDEIDSMGRRFGESFEGCPVRAAEFVVATEEDEGNEYHGIDVHDSDYNGSVLVEQSWGQIRDEIGEYFPEVVSLFPWHLAGLSWYSDLPQFVIDRVEALA